MTSDYLFLDWKDSAPPAWWCGICSPVGWPQGGCGDCHALEADLAAGAAERAAALEAWVEPPLCDLDCWERGRDCEPCEFCWVCGCPGDCCDGLEDLDERPVEDVDTRGLT